MGRLNNKAEYISNLTLEQKSMIEGIREDYSKLYDKLDNIFEGKGQLSREASLAYMNLEQSQMWVTKAISRMNMG